MEIDTLKKSLGKGLDSLIRSNNLNNNIEEQVQKKDEVFLTDIVPNKNQPRKDFNLASLNDLAESIKQMHTDLNYHLGLNVALLDSDQSKFIKFINSCPAIT